ncbi:SHOCT domain-containing protein [Agromyces sp. H3Y2-19a]|jgi:ABC-type multidrug transport system fused ATPase/permease subunit|uniref:SHOCT domain-containing protein n=1 Tax=Agromyces TaxID=33877 RepID=UPI001E4ABDDB|nr:MULTISPECIES: SHOCT domain-containing protein [Agromyces]MCD5346556.1 SHOCT domain-containing protein [Agromyces sp. S2-1-8]MDF0512916.1 SHOCT domain-containing protein [Agromyces chromiiresistens]
MNSFWDFLVWLFWIYIMIACIWIFITIIIDIFRDHTLNGWAKALWVVFLVFLPFLAAFIYLIARGRSMSERRMQEQADAQAQANAYIRSVAGAGGSSAAADIEKAKGLLDSGAISQAEYDQLKAKALAG